ncbi:hypothetical protein [Trinickia sp.]|uniref:hypothetical protein n=1 Tax=Trinickia sp. TaxID=2571163 RepID=UPI002D7FC3B2|nr:hypothetical protein [Trinickia sp.]
MTDRRELFSENINALALELILERLDPLALKEVLPLTLPNMRDSTCQRGSFVAIRSDRYRISLRR